MMKFKANGWLLVLFIASSLSALLLCAVFGVLTYVAWIESDALGRFFPTSLLFAMLIFSYGLNTFFFRKCYYSVEVNKEKAEIFINYPFRRKSILIKFTDIKGYSKSDDGASTLLNEKRCITLYLFNGQKTDFNQYQFRHFSKFEKLLETLPLTFLGTEPFEQDLLGNRIRYKY